MVCVSGGFWKSRSHINASANLKCIYGAAQFKLDRICARHGLDMTPFSFYVHACNIDDIKPMAQKSCVRNKYMHNSLHKRAW